MSIKYGDLTIIYDKEQTTLFTNLLMWLKYEQTPPNKSKYVFLFDDGEICDSDDKYKDFNYNFLIGSIYKLPLYFEKPIKKDDKNNLHIYFYKTPVEDKNNNNRLSIDSKKIFSSYSKHNSDIVIPSIYNSIYYCHKGSLKPEIFGLIRIKSNECMPRFHFAYDSDEFTKEEIIYVIHYIFNS